MNLSEAEIGLGFKVGKISGTVTNGVTLTSAAYSNPLTITSTGQVSSSGPEIIYGDPIVGQGWTVVNLGVVNQAQLHLYSVFKHDRYYYDRFPATLHGVKTSPISPSNGEVDSSAPAGIFLPGGGSVVNNGSIAAYNGIVIGSSPGTAGFVSNYGTILADNGIVLNAGGTVINSGRISCPGGYGVRVLGAGSVTNTESGYIAQMDVIMSGAADTVSNFGTITGQGIFLEAGGSVTNGGSGSSALINGVFGVQISGAAGTVDNMGTVEASADPGVFLLSGGSVTNLANGSQSAVIEGALAQGIFPGATGVLVEGGGTVTNGAPGLTADIIEAPRYGVCFYGNPGTVINFGAIMSIGTNASAHYAGVYLSKGGEVTNYALIEGPCGVRVLGGSGTVTNSGMITGSNGTAVLFESTGNRLVVDPGAVFQGTVDGGAGSSTLELAAGAGAGSLLGLGTSFVDFGTVIFDPGAAWTVEIPQGVVYTRAFSGFAKGDAIDLSGVGATSASYAGGVLTLDKGTTPEADLALSFGAGTVGVRLSPDGSSGTDVMALSQVVPADFNGDGYGNVLFRNELTGQLSFAAIIAGNFSGLGAATAGVNGYLFGGYGGVNGDGYADVVVQDPSSRTIYVAEQNGSGTPRWITAPAVPRWRVAGVGEIAGDGFADIVIQNQTSGAIDYYNVHNGTFTAVVASTASQVVGIGDVNGRGYDDIVLQNAATGEIDYLNMVGGVNTGLVPVVTTPGWEVRAVGDLTADGYADIVIQNEISGQTLFANMQGGMFNGWGQATAGLTPDYAVVDAVDVLGNGHADVIVQQQSTGATYYAVEGANGFVRWGSVTSLGADQPAVGNGLGLSHEAALASDYTASGTGDVLFRNDITGQLQFAEMSAGTFTGFGLATGGVDGFLYVGHGDVNGDGIADVVVQDPNRTIYVGLQNGSGTPSWITGPAVPGWQGVGVGGIAGDGYADIVIQNQTSGAIDYYDVHTRAFTTVVGSTASRVVGVGDVNGEGNDDIVLQNPATGEIDYLDMAGGVNNGLVTVATTPGWQVRAVGDLTGNGYADIVIENATGQTLFANMQGGVFRGWGQATTPLTSDYKVVDAVDVFNNGHADLIVQQQSTGATTYAEEGTNGFLQWGTVASLGPNWTAV
jgi:hypothetical protein